VAAIDSKRDEFAAAKIAAPTSPESPLQPFRQRLSDKHYLKVSHWLTLLWGVVRLLSSDSSVTKTRSALDQALSNLPP